MAPLGKVRARIRKDKVKVKVAVNLNGRLRVSPFCNLCVEIYITKSCTDICDIMNKMTKLLGSIYHGRDDIMASAVEHGRVPPHQSYRYSAEQLACWLSLVTAL